MLPSTNSLPHCSPPTKELKLLSSNSCNFIDYLLQIQTLDLRGRECGPLKFKIDFDNQGVLIICFSSPSLILAFKNPAALNFSVSSGKYFSAINFAESFRNFDTCEPFISLSGFSIPKNLLSNAKSISSEKRSINPHALLNDVPPLKTVCCAMDVSKPAAAYELPTSLFLRLLPEVR